jgi:antitoxin (DNA-binding transcriptional repressor) of toxin-antitoxin stability system
MTTTVEANSSELRELVARTQQGEEILVTVDGKVAGRLSAAEAPPAPTLSPENAKFIRELKERLKNRVVGHSGPSIQEIMDEQREERL